MSEPPLTGGCLCGAVRFEVTEPLVSSGYCHCTRCQRRTGTAASPGARIAPGSLRVLAGEEHIRAYEPDEGFAKVFCSACGSSLWSRSQEDPDVISIRLGAFDRFSRADDARSSQGAGLGLAIARAIARAHGGDSGARSRDDRRGADVWLVLPR